MFATVLSARNLSCSLVWKSKDGVIHADLEAVGIPGRKNILKRGGEHVAFSH